MVRLLAPADYRSMPWKNGGGRTTEIAVHPAESAIDDFAWRISIADVERDGPFSPFPNIDRVIVLLEGAGMKLQGGGFESVLATPFLPHAFSGDDAIVCTLVAGPIRDFNAMFRRGRAWGSVSVVRGEGEEFGPAEYRLAYAATGAHECVVPGNPPMTIAPGHSVLIDRSPDVSEPALKLRPLSADAVALVVSIECR
jgi:environmental stress-induced protein Ves